MGYYRETECTIVTFEETFWKKDGEIEESLTKDMRYVPFGIISSCAKKIYDFFGGNGFYPGEHRVLCQTFWKGPREVCFTYIFHRVCGNYVMSLVGWIGKGLPIYMGHIYLSDDISDLEKIEKRIDKLLSSKKLLEVMKYEAPDMYEERFDGE